MSDEAPEVREFRLRQVEATIERHAASLARSFEAATVFATTTLQLMGLAAGGGIAATLAFVAATWADLETEPLALAHANLGLFFMFASLILSVAAGLVSYICQSYYSRALSAQTYDGQPPYVNDTPESVRYNRIGGLLEWLTIGVGVGAIVSLGIGGYWFYRVINP